MARIVISNFSLVWMGVSQTAQTAATIHAIGLRGCGKSTLIHKLVKSLRSPAVLYDPLGNLHPPQANIYASVDDTTLPFNIVQGPAIQRVQVPYLNGASQLTLAFDNYSGDIAKYAPLLHAQQNVNIVMALQYMPSARYPADYIFCFHTPALAERQKIWATYCSNMVFNVFCTVLDACTRGQGDCLVIDNRRGNVDYRDLYRYNVIATPRIAASTIQTAWRAKKFLQCVRACARMARLKPELVEVTWHPQRMMDWCLAIDD